MINRKTYFPQYRITYDPAAETLTDPMYFQIPHRKGGWIYPSGGEYLNVEVFRNRATQRKLAELGLQVVQHGDWEMVFKFHHSRMDDVAALVKPYRRKTFSSESLVRKREAMAKARAKRLIRTPLSAPKTHDLPPT